MCTQYNKFGITSFVHDNKYSRIVDSEQIFVVGWKDFLMRK